MEFAFCFEDSVFSESRDRSAGREVSYTAKQCEPQVRHHTSHYTFLLSPYVSYFPFFYTSLWALCDMRTSLLIFLQNHHLQYTHLQLSPLSSTHHHQLYLCITINMHSITFRFDCWLYTQGKWQIANESLLNWPNFHLSMASFFHPEDIWYD